MPISRQFGQDPQYLPDLLQVLHSDPSLAQVGDQLIPEKGSPG